MQCMCLSYLRIWRPNSLRKDEKKTFNIKIQTILSKAVTDSPHIAYDTDISHQANLRFSNFKLRPDCVHLSNGYENGKIDIIQFVNSISCNIRTYISFVRDEKLSHAPADSCRINFIWDSFLS